MKSEINLTFPVSYFILNMHQLAEEMNAGLLLRNLNGDKIYRNEAWPFQYAEDPELDYPFDIDSKLSKLDCMLADQNKTPCLFISVNQMSGEFYVHIRQKIFLQIGDPFCYCSFLTTVKEFDQLKFILEKIKIIFAPKQEMEFSFHACVSEFCNTVQPEFEIPELDCANQC